MSEMVAQRIVEIMLAARELQEVSASSVQSKEVYDLLCKISWLGYIATMEMKQ
jgi:hypothetical protein